MQLATGRGQHFLQQPQVERTIRVIGEAALAIYTPLPDVKGVTG
ncbi:MAG: hypothetical protein ACXW2A_19475 [Burkholderiales bacterium]